MHIDSSYYRRENNYFMVYSKNLHIRTLEIYTPVYSTLAAYIYS